jgi:hypothetical protein
MTSKPFQVYSAASLPPKPPTFTPAILVLDEFLAALVVKCAGARVAFLASDEANMMSDDDIERRLASLGDDAPCGSD